MRGTKLRRALGALVALALMLPGRPGAADLVRIQGVPEQPIAIAGPHFERTFIVESATTQEIEVRVKALKLCGPADVAPIVLMDGKPLDSSPVKLPARDVLEVTMRAELPLEGRYQGALSVLPADQARISAPYTVERGPAVSPIEVELVPTVRGYAGDPVRVALDVHASPTVAGGVRVHSPRLVSLAQKGAGTTLWQPEGAYTVEVRDANDKDPGDPIRVSDALALRLRVKGLGPGEYTGTVRVEADGAKAIDKPITLVVKESGWCAAIVIGLSAAVAWGLRTYFKTGRPRLVALQRVWAARNAADAVAGGKAPLGDTEASVWREVQRQADSVAARLDAGTAPEAADGAIGALEEKPELLRTWIEAARACAEVRRSGHAVDSTIQQKVDAAHAALLDSGASAADVIARARELHALGSQLGALIRDARTAEIDALLNEARAQPSPTTPEHAQLLQSVVDALQKASLAVKRDELTKARAHYDAARLELARLRGRELLARLDRSAPAELEPRWEALRASLTPALNTVVAEASDADRAVEAAARAYREFATRWLDALGHRAAQSKQIADEVRSGTEKLEKGDFVWAIAACERASALLSGAAPSPAASRRTPSEPLPWSVPGAQAWGLSPPGKLWRVRSALRPTKARIRALDVVTNAVLLVIAVLLGLQVLWVNDPTWGGTNAIIVAVLWGAGLHAVSGVTFDGIAGLREKMAK